MESFLWNFLTHFPLKVFGPESFWKRSQNDPLWSKRGRKNCLLLSIRLQGWLLCNYFARKSQNGRFESTLNVSEKIGKFSVKLLSPFSPKNFGAENFWKRSENDPLWSKKARKNPLLLSIRLKEWLLCNFFDRQS